MTQGTASPRYSSRISSERAWTAALRPTPPNAAGELRGAGMADPLVLLLKFQLLVGKLQPEVLLDGVCGQVYIYRPLRQASRIHRPPFPQFSVASRPVERGELR